MARNSAVEATNSTGSALNNERSVDLDLAADQPDVKYVRRSIEMHPDVNAQLDRLKAKLRLRSHSDVLQRAVQLLDAVAHEDENGMKIFIESRNGKMQQVRLF